MLNFKEKMLVTVLLFVIGVSFVSWFYFLLVSVTKTVPKAGGEYTEGVIGQPLYINPLLSQTSEADSDLASLVYSGLFKYDKDGKAVNDLAESVDVSADQRTYSVHLRKNLKWQDGTNLGADDVMFTVALLQDQAYKSPLRQNWQGVDVSLGDENIIIFSLKNPYVGFVDNLTVGILPKHIWENIAPEKFALAQYNLNPIGSGPYAYASLQKDSGGNILTYRLVANKYYYDKIPYIPKMTFNFYPDEDLMIAAYNKKEVMGISNIEPDKVALLKNIKSTTVHEFVIPRYFGLFLNQIKSPVLASDSVRGALDLSVDRSAIINEVLKGKGTAITSPFIATMKEYVATGDSGAQLDAAKKLLDDNGWKQADGSAVRKKGDLELKFEIVTADWPELVKTAELMQKQWEKIGVQVSIKALSISDLQQNYIRTRDYDSLLFGQVISFNPDLYSFWHSSQKLDPGLNLALFDNKDADQLLTDVRQEPDQQKRIDKYKELQKIFAKTENVPAVFLYSPYYLYPTKSSLSGVTAKNINMPNQRFVDVNQWYIQTSRVLK